ncbi:MAG: hypothetical protein QXS54_06410 [Candidatus Methanomethylicaceae archaeon]
MRQLYVTKTGLAIFDTARAYGLANLVVTARGSGVRAVIEDQDWCFIISVDKLPTNPPSGDKWAVLFQPEGTEWSRVFITYGQAAQGQQRKRVRQVLEKQFNDILSAYQNPLHSVTLGSSGETLPGGLEPAAFKGLRHPSRRQYSEGPIKVPKEDWALACLGMATCAVYRYSREVAQGAYLALLSVPEFVRFAYFRTVQQMLRGRGLRYRGVQNAAAHYAVLLADEVRKARARQPQLQDRFSGVDYFTLFRTGNQWKPSQGGRLNLGPLMNALSSDPHATEPMLRWLDYCFRRGSTEGGEELALATTEFVMRFDLTSYERLARVFARFIAGNKVNIDNLPNEKTLKEVMGLVKA